MAKKLWGGRFKKKIDSEFETFSNSLWLDHRLLPYDLKIDRAHVNALRGCGVLNAVEASKLLKAIAALEKKYQAGQLKASEAHEDVHSWVQAELEKIAGETAKKLHTARSRNDLVSQSTRLYCKNHAEVLIQQIQALQKELVVLAEKNQAVLIPGMTHLQNAQVISAAHLFLAWAEMLERAVLRLQGSQIFFDVCVLGSGALAGTTFPLDQKKIAKELGLSQVTRNSYDVSGDRDFVLNILSCVVFTGLQLSRISEDLMIGQTKGNSLFDIDEAFCTGSSMMPQKKNADFVELVRGASSTFAANFVGILSLLKALPTSYNRDLQWDKRFLFDSVERLETILPIFSRLVKTLSIRTDRAKELLKDESLYATDLADYLVGKGLAFKKAHEVVGQIVSFAEEKKVAISKMGLDLLRQFESKIEGDVYDLFNPEHSVRLKRTQGSTHPAEIKKQIGFWKNKLKKA